MVDNELALSEYEKLRLKNIQDNQAQMKLLGLEVGEIDLTRSKLSESESEYQPTSTTDVDSDDGSTSGQPDADNPPTFSTSDSDN